MRVLAALSDMVCANGLEEPLRFTAAFADGRDLYAFRYSVNNDANTLYYRASGKEVVIVSEPLDGDRSVWVPVPPDHMVVAKADQPVACMPLPREARVAAE